jgi:hypothetical protein
VVTAAARPVFWIGEDQQIVRGWPIGPALLETLAEINPDVQDALADERARLSEDGYPDDLPIPALWWSPGPGTERATGKRRLTVVNA